MPIVVDIDGACAHYFCLKDGKVIDTSHANSPKILLRANSIRVGCAVVSVEAAKHILAEWEKQFGDKQDAVQLQ